MRKYSDILSALLLLIYVPTALFLSVSHFHGISVPQESAIKTVSGLHHPHAEFNSEDSENNCFICHFLNTQISADTNPKANPIFFTSLAVEYSYFHIHTFPFRSIDVRGPPFVS